jgi:hypothetical protein
MYSTVAQESEETILGNASENGRIILKRILMKQGMRACTEFIFEV